MGGAISPVTWSVLFWTMILFSAIQAGAKSFLGERRGREFYYFSLVEPGVVMVAKIAYSFFLILLISFTGAGLFFLLIQNPIKDNGTFFLLLILSSLGFAGSLSLLSGLAAKASNGSVLMAVLSFPVVISILTISIRVTKNCIDGLDPSVSLNSLLTLLAIGLLTTALAYVLFPFIWRS